MKWKCIATTCLFCLSVSALAQDLPELKDKIVYVAAFKNGLGFLLREGEARLQSGWGVSHVVPEAAHGTFWITPTKEGARIDQLVAYKQDVSTSEPAVSVRELLRANIGKVATLKFADSVSTGMIAAVPEIRNQDDTVPYSSRRAVAPEQASIVILRTDSGSGQGPGIVAANIGQITYARIEGEANTVAGVKRTARRLKFKLTGCGDLCPVSTAYIEKGITWAPSYLVELIDEEKARINMQGLLANDVEDLDGATVCFVVGYPNFVYADVLSPLSLKQSVGEFIQTLTSDTGDERYAGRYSRVMAQSALANVASFDESSVQPGFSYRSVTGTPGAQEEDLFLYRKTGVTLKKGERGYYEMFSAIVPFEHIYEWDSPDESRIDNYGNISSSPNQKPDLQDQVWHKVKLTDTSEYPWTTAPAFTLSNRQPLAEDILDYTSKGGTTKLRLTVATDIKARAEEEELARAEARLPGYNYWKVTSKGKLSLKNSKSKVVTVQVIKHLTGEVIDDGGGKSTKTVRGIKAVNPASTITWSLTLKAGEEKNVEYTYTTLVRY